ncbi:flagellin lysine-N-methylase [Clostridium gasigenes]|uniref:flagellin lysine-N-methylase n=1 Tax=Clostridium gasigenes TaxID=94869 RepID=UPI0014382C36|nr:flagellin lysine-N-methylase [Clostridium gasigenes]NKF08736.1 lysine-N-methylase [Clostridium gasigenes]QSW19977.1 flagellin lysine-N-methylase [Clostridium gasigenes]
MNKGIDILKISNYDKFNCIADKCKFTCCEGWDVSIDTDTYNKWEKENDKVDYIFNNVKIKKCGSKTEYFIDKETGEACPFLDKQGLCQIVKGHGEGYLSLTCHTFPRIENIFEDRKELSLSCACPEVVELMGSIAGKINIISEKDTNLKSHLLELRIREALINIINQENFLLEDKLIISFEMLLTTLENKNIREDTLLEKIEKYNKGEYIQKLIATYNEIELNTDDSIEEINSLFLDIIQNYKEVSILEELFKDSSNFAETIKIESLSAKWHDYKSLFEEHNKLIENCIVAKILSSCVSNDVEEMAISFQMIILEYLLVRYAVFLKYCMNKNEKIDPEDIKDYIVAFSRIIGNNTDAMIEFFEDGFGKAVLEMGYFCFITLF